MKGSTTEARLWAYRALDGPLVFKYSATKQGIIPAQALKNYQGRLQTDGASNFADIPDKEGIIHLACWVHARRYFRHAPSRIDNNLVENAIRPLKLGARNGLFIGHPDAGDGAALMFTLVENCKLAKINPETYLADVLARIDDYPASRISELTPQGWAKIPHHAGK